MWISCLRNDGEVRTKPVRRGALQGRGRISPWPRRLAAIAAVGVAFTIVGLWLGAPSRLSESMRATERADSTGGPDRAEAGPRGGERARDRRRSGRGNPEGGRSGGDPAGVALASDSMPTPVRHRFDRPPRAGVMFDVDTGEIVWERHLDRKAKIASLTKMMTAHLITKRHGPDERVRIPGAAVAVGGSKVGLLPQGKKVPLGGLLKGLLLVSGNDAAVALAIHDAGSEKRFVLRMNAAAKRLGLECTRFSSPHGLEDRGNYSCPRDLAALARLLLGNRRLAKVMGSKVARVEFPVEGGMLELANNNPFIRAGDRSVTGVKTGFTQAAGRCYVMSAKRRGRHLGVVLLDAPDPLRQVPKLWRLGFEARG